MKKRIISLLLLLVLCVTTVISRPAEYAQAAQTQAQEQLRLDPWTVPDLVYGVTYGIYPDRLFQTDLTKNITLGNLYILISGVRCKFLESGYIVEKEDLNLDLDYTITVEDVLKAFHTLLTEYEFSADIGLGNGLTAVDYMKQYGIYTGQNGEQALTDRCSTQQALVIATRLITYLYDTLDAASKGFLWQVKEGENTVYMLGSIHVASYSIYPFSKTLLQDFFQSNALIVEANLNDQADLQAFTNLAYYSDGTSLKDHVSAETYQKTIAATALIGLSEEVTNTLKPWFLYLLVEDFLAISSEQNGNQVSADLGIDVTLLTYAELSQKPVYAIEGLKGQALILDSFSSGLQEYLLNADIEAMNSALGNSGGNSVDSNEDVELMLQYWHDGNVEGFHNLNSVSDTTAEGLTGDELTYYNEYQEKFFAQRDQNMADYIDGLLKSEGSNTYFVVVGSFHYVSDYSVIDRLEKKGYEVKLVEQ